MAFIGWNTAPDSSGTAYDAKKYLKFDDFAADITLYAQWMLAHRHDISTDCGVSDASVDFTIWTSSTSLSTSSGRYILANDAGYQDHITSCDCAEAPKKITRPSDSAYALVDLSGYKSKRSLKKSKKLSSKQRPGGGIVRFLLLACSIKRLFDGSSSF